MAKSFVQRNLNILKSSASLAAGASVSGSSPSTGFARIVGGLIVSASSVAGSGLSIRQSFDGGANWDHVTACQITANSGSAFSVAVVGDAVQVFYKTDSAASVVRMNWELRPI